MPAIARRSTLTGLCLLACLAFGPAFAGDQPQAVLRGAQALGGIKQDGPGVRRLITPSDLPKPYATRSASNNPRIVKRPADAQLRVPEGFRASLFADGFGNPRLMRVAPNGDVFLADMSVGAVQVLRPSADGSRLERKATFVSGLSLPFGIAFWPPGPEPRYVYVGATDSVVRYPYVNGDMEARGPAEVIVPKLPTGGHATRDVVFSPDGSRMYVSVGSESNVGENMGKRSVRDAEVWDARKGAIGAAWDDEEDRATVLSFTPEGKDRKIFATGLRNCVGLAVQPGSGTLWCATNERDGLGDNLPPDYVTSVRQGAFYGWPWYYIGKHEDPRLAGARPDLRDRVTVPDVLIQPHSAPLQLAFHDGKGLPEGWGGSIFVALHGSWNRSGPTGYKVVRAIMKDGKATGEYEDFLVGFATPKGQVWGRPVGVAQMKDGSLLVSEDVNGTVWRVAREAGGQAPSP